MVLACNPSLFRHMGSSDWPHSSTRQALSTELASKTRHPWDFWNLAHIGYFRLRIRDSGILRYEERQGQWYKVVGWLLEDLDFVGVEKWNKFRSLTWNGLHEKVRMDMIVDRIEVIWIEIIRTKCKPLIIENIYRPPHTNTNRFIATLLKILTL